MADSGIQRIDDLLNKTGEAPLTGADSVAAIGAIQDLMRGHGGTELPSLTSDNYGATTADHKFKPATLKAIHKFQKDHNLKVEDQVSATMLAALVRIPATTPVASQVYMALVLGIPAGGAGKILSLVAIAEGGGKFTAIARNPDKAGLSLGIIQWAQKPGRLFELLDGWNTANAGEMKRIFGGADKVAAMLAYVKKGKAGLKPDGTSNDPNIDLLTDDSIKKFKEALADPLFQASQVTTAAIAFQSAADFIHKFDTKKKIVSERGLAFMLDLANQHGPGGAKKIYNAVVTDAMTEAEALQAMADESVRRIAKQFPAKLGEKESVFTRGGRERRTFYLKTKLLSDDPIQDAPPPPVPDPNGPVIGGPLTLT